MNLSNKNIIVTGAGSGMGRELTLQLIQKGATVAAVDLNESTLNETKSFVSQNHLDQISLHILDITDQAKVEAFAEKVIQQYSAIDGIVNNAGIIQPFIKINELDYSTINKVMNVNFYGTVYMTKSILPHLIKRPEAFIANVSSMGGFLPVPGQGIYGASKAAVKLFTESLHAELIDTKVNVTAIFPGGVDTNIMDNSGIDPEKIKKMEGLKEKSTPLTAQKAAEAMIRGIEKNKARVYVGKDSKMMNNLYRFFPSYACKMIAKNMKQLLD